MWFFVAAIFAPARQAALHAIALDAGAQTAQFIAICGIANQQNQLNILRTPQ